MNSTLHNLAISNQYDWIAYSLCTITLLFSFFTFFFYCQYEDTKEHLNNEEKLKDLHLIEKLFIVSWLLGGFSFFALTCLTDLFIKHA